MELCEDRLETLRRQLERQRQLRQRRASLQSQLRQLEEREAELAAQRAEEQEDVDRLEGGSLAAYFYRLTGSLEDRLDRERREAWEAAVRHDAVLRELDAVRQDLDAAEEELRSLAGCEERYQAALAEKAAALKAQGTPQAGRLRQLEERLAALAGQRRELQEARAAGEAALATTDDILSSLSSAEGWGTWDLLGGGLLTDLAKHGHLDDAQRNVEYLQVQLRRFRTELADVAVDADLHVQIEGFLRFADYFFDGLFADWAVLDRIHNSQSQVQKTRDQIWRVLDRLQDLETAADQEQASLEQERENFIVRA